MLLCACVVAKIKHGENIRNLTSACTGRFADYGSGYMTFIAARASNAQTVGRTFARKEIMKKITMWHEGREVRVIAEGEGWSMIRCFKGAFPVVVRSKELTSQPTGGVDAAPITDEMLDDAREAKN